MKFIPTVKLSDNTGHYPYKFFFHEQNRSSLTRHWLLYAVHSRDPGTNYLQNMRQYFVRHNARTDVLGLSSKHRHHSMGHGLIAHVSELIVLTVLCLVVLLSY